MDPDFQDFDSIFNTLQECKQNEYLPETFFRALSATLKQPTMKTLVTQWFGSLQEFFWDDDAGSFSQLWSLETVDFALERMTKWRTNQPSVKLEVTQGVPDDHLKHKNKKMLPKWQELVGEFETSLSLGQFVKVNKILSLRSEQALADPFVIELSDVPLNPLDLTGWIGKILPYMIQKIKMWGCFNLEPRLLKNLVQELEQNAEKPVSTGPKMFKRNMEFRQNIKTESQSTLPFSRIDLITCIVNCVDVLVAQDLLKNMAMFPVALPLIIPSIFNNDVINVAPMLKHFPIRWKNGEDVVENYLFSSPFKLVLAFRLGSSLNVGKSCILNQVLKREYVFSCRQEPGATFGVPIALPGFVEFIPLTEETCKSDLWENGIKHQTASRSNSVVLLANMHGNPWDHLVVFNAVLQMATGVVVFCMPNVDTDQSEIIWKDLTGRFGKDLSYLEVDAHENEEETTINVVDLMNDVTLSKVRKAIVKALSSRRSVIYDDLNLEKFSSLQSTNPDRTGNTKKITDLVRKLTCKVVKNSILTDRKCQKNDTLYVIQGLRSILCLPLNDRMRAITDLERLVTELSNEESIEARCQLVKLEAELKKETGKLNNSNPQRLNDMNKRICDLLTDINESNLGVEHFYRMLGGFYEKTLRENPLQTNDFPQGYAELLLHGFAIELLNGDVSPPTIQGPWLSAICDKVCSTYGDLRVYVVTVIGLQSSGKSTLLNALFGCKFAVSVGRCTRGLFMRLLLLDENLVQELGVDAVLLIDMEGLGAPEKVNDPESDKKDRLMATYAMGISNLTLINIYGEAANSMTDILQVAIVAMARLEEAKMDPDLYVVQHLSEKNQQKLATAHNEFIKAIQKVVELTEQKGIHIGVMNSSCLNNLVLRIEKGNVLKAFGPFRDGERVNSPPSQGYHESVVDLYKSILEACMECKRKQKLSVWSSLLEGYLDAVLKEDIAVRFKNLTDMAEHIEREREIAKAKEAIEKSFRQHADNLEKVIIERIKCKESLREQFTAQQDQVDDALINMIKFDFASVPQTCLTDKNTQCEQCCNAVSQMKSLLDNKQHEHESSQTLQTFKEATNELYEIKMKNMIGAQRLQQGCSKEFQTILNNSLKKHKHDFGAQPTDLEKALFSDLVWKELKHAVAEKYQYKNIEERLKQDIANVYHDQPRVLTCYCNSKIIDMRKIPAVGRIESLKGVRKQGFKSVINQQLDEKDYYDLERMLRDAPARFVESNKIQDYSSQVMTAVRYDIIELIQDFERNIGRTLHPMFQFEVHIIALKRFGNYLAQMQWNWESQYHPRILLELNEDFYRNFINTRLTLGFSAVAEGRIIADLLLQDACAKASKFAHEKRVDKACNEQWMINSENVRLMFFEKLADEVDRGDKVMAIEFFSNPKDIITMWFQVKVEELYPDISSYYNATFTTEIDISIQTVRNADDMSEIMRLLNAMSGDYYEPSDASRYNMEVLKTNIEMGIEKKRDEIKNKPSKLSTDPRVMARLGCVEHCIWCGALCWGHAGHQQDSGSTRRHHACHQPAGLKGVGCRTSKQLLTDACHEQTDNDKVYWGHFYENGLSWKEAKIYFNNWIFDPHHKTHFNQLMHWFFLKLNADLAATYRRLPAPAEYLQSEAFTSLTSERVDRILATVRQKLN